MIVFWIVIPPPAEYQHDTHELEKRNQLLNDEVQQLLLNNRVRFNFIRIVLISKKIFRIFKNNKMNY